MFLSQIREATICSLLLISDLIWKTNGIPGDAKRNYSQKSDRHNTGADKSPAPRRTSSAVSTPSAAAADDCQSVPMHSLWRKLALSSDRSALRTRQLLTTLFDGTGAATAMKLTRKFQEDENTIERQRRRRRRKNNSSSSSSTTPSSRQQCSFRRRWRRMPAGVFPPFVETGRCSRTPCMMGHYRCAPQRYSITVLKRVPNECRPLVTTTLNRSNVEVWRLAERRVTVGCSCSKRVSPGISAPLATTPVL